MPYQPHSTAGARRRKVDPLPDGSRIPEPRTAQDDVTPPPLPARVTLPAPRHTQTLTERFEAFHNLNGHVYDALVRLARRYYRATGETKQSVQRLIEIARWDEKIRTKGESDFLLNNDFAAFYARLIMFREADLRDIFQLRRSDEADNWIAEQMRRAA